MFGKTTINCSNIGEYILLYRLAVI